MPKESAAPFLRPHRARPASGAANAQVDIRGLEVVQSIQTLDNRVTLIADKPCFVRVYLVLRDGPRAFSVTGELKWRRRRGGWHYLSSMSAHRLRRSADIDLAAQRLTIDSSLNFQLPVEAVQEGQIELSLNWIQQVGGQTVDVAAPPLVNLAFVAAPTLHVRAIGLRYFSRTARRTFAPDAVHFEYMRSYLLRALPIARLSWSQTVVDADFEAPFADGTPVRANAQLAAIRSREVSAGMDARTHYYGLVSDANGLPRHFMRGLASGIPGVPSPDTVASGPVGVPGGFAGDQDQSYADWYGTHELGHTFGRFHPGFPPGRQDASDPTFPYPHGRITDTQNRFVGLDRGDASLMLPLRILPGETHHDVMTYAENQWVSEYTFNAVLARLQQEDTLLRGMSNQGDGGAA